LSEVLRGIIAQEQEHEIDLSTALDIEVPPPIDPHNGKDSRAREQKPEMAKR
jgi:hypothetical protein